MHDEDEYYAKIRKELESLKTKIKLASIVGVLLGSGGLFGIYKWFDTDRELIIAETRAKTLETEVLKYNTLAADYAKRIAPLEARIALAKSENTTAEKKEVANIAARKVQLEVSELIKKRDEELERIREAITKGTPNTSN